MRVYSYCCVLFFRYNSSSCTKRFQSQVLIHLLKLTEIRYRSTIKRYDLFILFVLTVNWTAFIHTSATDTQSVPISQNTKETTTAPFCRTKQNQTQVSIINELRDKKMKKYNLLSAVEFTLYYSQITTTNLLTKGDHIHSIDSGIHTLYMSIVHLHRISFCQARNKIYCIFLSQAEII